MTIKLFSVCSQKKDKHKFIIKLILLLFIYIIPLSCSRENSSSEKSVTFEVVLPPNARDSAVYITGNLEELGSWKADEIPLSKTPEGIWKRTFKLKKGRHVEYKFTRGSWETEAANPDGSIPQNSLLEVSTDTTLTVYIGQWLSQSFSGTTNLPTNAFNNPVQMYVLDPYWKYHSGDDTAWASPKYNDQGWTVKSTLTMPQGDSTNDWKGIGWFRLHINMDTMLVKKPVYLLCDHCGASEIYLNGKLIRKLGRIGNPPETETDYIQKGPIIINFDGANDQLLAVRYSNYKIMPLMKYNFSPGFNIILSDPEKFIKIIETRDKNLIISEMASAGIPLILGLVHLLFFIFYRQDKTNLFYGLCLLAFSVSFFIGYQKYFTDSPQTMLFYGRLSLLTNPLIVLFGILSAFSAYKDRNYTRVLIFTAAAVLLGIWSYFSPTKTSVYIFYIYIVFAIAEIFRLMIHCRTKREGSPWILGVGFGILGAVLIYDIIIDIGLIKPVLGLIIDTSFGMLGLIVAQSINLSLGFARTHKNLEKQLKQVKELSDKALEQERFTRHQEMKRKLLEADNKRKTHELEEARRIQLSMLPKTIPEFEQVEIAAFMKTATEVGGDYYDFKVNGDNSLIAAIGDATGHGTKAGTMVTIVKILFNELTGDKDLLSILRKYTDAIKLMNLNQLYMGLTLLNIKGHEIKTVSAGMPPFLIYHSEDKCIEEVIIKGMPLGSFTDFPYQQREFSLSKGDVILLMSDGYMEQFNSNKEMLGIDSAKKILKENAEKGPQDIIDKLMENLIAWQNEFPQQDDMTFVVLKFK